MEERIIELLKLQTQKYRELIEINTRPALHQYRDRIFDSQGFAKINYEGIEKLSKQENLSIKECNDIARAVNLRGQIIEIKNNEDNLYYLFGMSAISFVLGFYVGSKVEDD